MTEDFWRTAEPSRIRHALWERYRLPRDAADAIYQRLNTAAWDAMERRRLEEQVKELVARLPPEEEREPARYRSEWE
jgi:hypothetical protein